MWFFLRPVEDFSKHTVIMVKCKSVYFACQEFLSRHRNAYVKLINPFKSLVKTNHQKLSKNKGDLESLAAMTSAGNYNDAHSAIWNCYQLSKCNKK